MFECNRDRKLREAMQEIGGAIQRIKDPLVFRVFTTFFGQNAIFRVGLAQYIDNRLLGFTINVGDEIIITLGGNG